MMEGLLRSLSSLVVHTEALHQQAGAQPWDPVWVRDREDGPWYLRSFGHLTKMPDGLRVVTFSSSADPEAVTVWKHGKPWVKGEKP